MSQPKYALGDKVRRIDREDPVEYTIIAVGPWKVREGDPYWYGLRSGPEVEGELPRHFFDAWEKWLAPA